MDERIKNVLDHIEENLNSNLDLDSLSSIACLSTSQFHRLFKKETGVTPFKFLEAMKMEKAHQLILKGEMLVSDIADLLNYNDYETFTRAYKKHFGLSPDDLKAIASSVKSESQNEGEGEILIRTVDSEEDLSTVFSEMEELMKSKGISVEEIHDSKVFRIKKKGDEHQTGETLIKNKFLMDPDQQLWKKLLAYRST